MNTWTIVKDEAAYERALSLAKGSYQQGLLLGYENLSGSTLKGAAKHWGGRYARSRDALLARLKKAGIPVSEQTGDHGKRLLVIG